ncbi:MAG: hypothetical protein WAV78_36720, partial [Xanthobacteraceae bacterium]
HYQLRLALTIIVKGHPDTIFWAALAPRCSAFLTEKKSHASPERGMPWGDRGQLELGWRSCRLTLRLS